MNSMRTVCIDSYSSQSFLFVCRCLFIYSVKNRFRFKFTQKIIIIKWLIGVLFSIKIVHDFSNEFRSTFFSMVGSDRFALFLEQIFHCAIDHFIYLLNFD